MPLISVHTGEEGEETIYHCRAKLYVMQSDGGWKERGVGALKLNVRSADGKSPRLGMFSFSPPSVSAFFFPLPFDYDARPSGFISLPFEKKLTIQ